METRGARRAAERVAKELIRSRAALVGELGVRQAEQADGSAAVSAAERQARELLEAATSEGARLVADAQHQERECRARYAAAYSAATAGGWSPRDLAAMGFTLRRRGPQLKAAVGTEPAAPGDGQREQNNQRHVDTTTLEKVEPASRGVDPQE